MRTKWILASALALSLSAPARAQAPKLEVGQEYLVRLYANDKQCNGGWIPLKSVGYSEHGDVIEVQLLGQEKPQRMWMVAENICESQKMRAAPEKDHK